MEQNKQHNLSELIEASYKTVSLAGCFLGDGMCENLEDLYSLATDDIVDSSMAYSQFVKLDIDEPCIESAELNLSYGEYENWLFSISIECRFYEHPTSTIEMLKSFFETLKSEKRYRVTNYKKYVSSNEIVITNGLLNFGLVFGTYCQYHTLTVYVEQSYDSEMCKEEATEIYKSLSYAIRNDWDIELICPQQVNVD